MAEQPHEENREEEVIGNYDTPHLQPTTTGIQAPRTNANNVEIRTTMINMVQANKFLGTAYEDPIAHLKRFERICSTIKINGVGDDAIRLTLFPFSLGDAAAEWENEVESSTITTWEQCKAAFMLKFYSKARTAKIRTDIYQFKQQPQEELHAAWDRFMKATKLCPHHGMTEIALLAIFHRGLNERYYELLDSAAGGIFADISATKGKEIIEKLSQSEKNRGTSSFYKPINPSPPSHQENEELKALKEQLSIVKNKMDKLNVKGAKGVHMVEEEEEICHIGVEEQTQEGWDEIHALGDFQYAQRYQGQGQSQNYKPYPPPYYNNRPQGYSNQPYGGQGFNNSQRYQTQGYGPRPTPPHNSNQQAHFQPSHTQRQPSNTPQDDKMEALLNKVLEGQGTLTVDTNAKFNDISKRIDGVYGELSTRIEHLNTHMKGVDSQIAQIASTSKAPTGHLPGKPQVNPKGFVGMMTVRDERHEIAKRLICEERARRLVARREVLVGNRGKRPNFNDAMRGAFSRNPSRLNALIRPRLIEKVQDPGQFVISCDINKTGVDGALADTGANINIMTSSMMRRLDIPTLEPSTTPIYMADASISSPLGKLKDVPVVIEGCVVITDFVVVQSKDEETHHLVLGRPFLSAVGAILDFHTNTLTLAKLNDIKIPLLTREQAFRDWFENEARKMYEDESQVENPERASSSRNHHFYMEESEKWVEKSVEDRECELYDLPDVPNSPPHVDPLKDNECYDGESIKNEWNIKTSSSMKEQSLTPSIKKEGVTFGMVTQETKGRSLGSIPSFTRH